MYREYLAQACPKSGKKTGSNLSIRSTSPRPWIRGKLCFDSLAVGKLTVSIYGMRETIAAPFRARLEQSTHVVYQALEIKSGGIDILPPTIVLIIMHYCGDIFIRSLSTRFCKQFSNEIRSLIQYIAQAYKHSFSHGKYDFRHQTF